MSINEEIIARQGRPIKRSVSGGSNVNPQVIARQNDHNRDTSEKVSSSSLPKNLKNLELLSSHFHKTNNELIPFPVDPRSPHPDRSPQLDHSAGVAPFQINLKDDKGSNNRHILRESIVLSALTNSIRQHAIPSDSENSSSNTSYPSFDYTTSPSPFTYHQANNLRQRVSKAPHNTPTSPHVQFGYQATALINLQASIGLPDIYYDTSPKSTSDSDSAYSGSRKGKKWLKRLLPPSELIKGSPSPWRSRESRSEEPIISTEESTLERQQYRLPPHTGSSWVKDESFGSNQPANQTFGKHPSSSDETFAPRSHPSFLQNEIHTSTPLSTQSQAQWSDSEWSTIESMNDLSLSLTEFSLEGDQITPDMVLDGMWERESDSSPSSQVRRLHGRLSSIIEEAGSTSSQPGTSTLTTPNLLGSFEIPSPCLHMTPHFLETRPQIPSSEKRVEKLPSKFGLPSLKRDENYVSPFQSLYDEKFVG